MSLLDNLPPYLVATINAPVGAPARRGIREDLLLIPAAEAAGWVGEFPNGSWHNAAEFTRGEVAVWGTGRDWRRARLGNSGRYSKPEVFSTLAEALGLSRTL